MELDFACKQWNMCRSQNGLFADLFFNSTHFFVADFRIKLLNLLSYPISLCIPVP